MIASRLCSPALGLRIVERILSYEFYHAGRRGHSQQDRARSGGSPALAPASHPLLRSEIDRDAPDAAGDPGGDRANLEPETAEGQGRLRGGPAEAALHRQQGAAAVHHGPLHYAERAAKGDLHQAGEVAAIARIALPVRPLSRGGFRSAPVGPGDLRAGPGAGARRRRASSKRSSKGSSGSTDSTARRLPQRGARTGRSRRGHHAGNDGRQKPVAPSPQRGGADQAQRPAFRRPRSHQGQHHVDHQRTTGRRSKRSSTRRCPNC